MRANNFCHISSLGLRYGMSTEFFDKEFNGNIDLPTNFKNLSFENCSFAGCDFKEFSLTGTRFVDCRFNTCDLSNVNVSAARLRDSTFENCKLLGVQWNHFADVMSPTFKSSNLSYSNFVGLKLKKIIFQDCILGDVDFSQADLSECNFKGSDFLNAKFYNTVLVKANFVDAINYLIDPISNKLKGARFSMPEAIGLLNGLGVVIEPQ